MGGKGKPDKPGKPDDTAPFWAGVIVESLSLIAKALDLFFDNNKRQHQLIMIKLSELEANFDGLKASLTEAFGEVTAKIAELEAALGDATIPAAAETKLEELKALGKQLADIVQTTPAP